MKQEGGRSDIKIWPLGDPASGTFCEDEVFFHQLPSSIGCPLGVSSPALHVSLQWFP